MSSSTVSDQIKELFKSAADLHAKFADEHIDSIAKASEVMSNAINNGNKLIWFGNGGSATQSQHMAGEFVGRFSKNRRSLPSISLCENIASLTAIGNDYSYEDIFSRQIEGLAQKGDVVIGISTSGTSKNVVRALKKARELQIATIGLTGISGGDMASLCDICVCVPSDTTARIQEAHLTIGHILCALIEESI